MKLKRVYIEITNVCNLNCSFCSPLKREKGFMKLSQFEHILKEIKPYSPHIYLHVKGEPLLHPDFEEFLKCAAKYSLPVNLTTNGTLIKKHMELLLKYPRQINISVHALSDNQIENYNDYIASVCQLGLEAKKQGSPFVSYRMWNGSDKEKISEDSLLILKKIAEYFELSVEENISRGRDAKKLADNVFISFMDEFEWPNEKNEYIGNTGKCLGGKEMLGILSNGTVVPCCLDVDGVIALGNIFTESLENILKKERFKNLEKGFSGGIIPEPLCQRCSYRTRFSKL